MVNDMKNIKCQDNDLWNLHVEGKSTGFEKF